MNILMIRLRLIFLPSVRYEFGLFYLDFVYPAGKPMMPHLLCYQGLAVDDYDFALDAADLGHPQLSLN